jgi:hypothetical protein
LPTEDKEITNNLKWYKDFAAGRLAIKDEIWSAFGSESILCKYPLNCTCN